MAIALSAVTTTALLGLAMIAIGTSVVLAIMIVLRDPRSPASERWCQVLGGRGSIRRPLHISRHVV
jgi:hypothetical protein